MEQVAAWEDIPPHIQDGIAEVYRAANPGENKFWIPNPTTLVIWIMDGERVMGATRARILTRDRDWTEWPMLDEGFLPGPDHRIDSNSAMMSGTSVHPNYQGKGIGKKLLCAMMHELRHLRYVMVHILDGNEISRKLFKEFLPVARGEWPGNLRWTAYRHEFTH